MGGFDAINGIGFRCRWNSLTFTL